MTNTRKITWIPRKDEEAPRDGKSFYAFRPEEISYYNERIQEAAWFDCGKKDFFAVNKSGWPQYPMEGFTHWTRDKVTP